MSAEGTVGGPGSLPERFGIRAERARIQFMELKPSEIVIIVLALAIPIGGFTLLFIPGGIDGIFGFAMHPEVRPYVFYGGAVVVFGILAWRIYRRIRPRQRNRD